MSEPCRTAIEAIEIQKQLNEFKRRMKEREDEVEYREWCEGIIMSAIATLGLISGDFK